MADRLAGEADLRRHIEERMNAVMAAFQDYQSALARGSGAVKAAMAGDVSLADIQRRDYEGEAQQAGSDLDQILLDDIVALRSMTLGVEDREAADQFARSLAALRRAVEAGMELVATWEAATHAEGFGAWTTQSDDAVKARRDELVQIFATEMAVSLDHYRRSLAALAGG